VPEPDIKNGWASLVYNTSLIIRMQSPKTGINSGEVCAIDGWAFAYNTYELTESVTGARIEG
jgi:hypothetical protein